MYFLLSMATVVVLLIAIGWWWRYRSLACPASFTFLLENRYMNAVAGPERLFERMKLSAGMRLLDVGCGPGRLALPAARCVGSRGEVVALDLQGEMLDKLHKRAVREGIENIRLVCAAAGSGAVEKAYFDRALLVTVLGEIPNQQQAIDEIYQALKEGGILSITELIPDPHYTRRRRVRFLCQQAGFTEREVFGSWSAFTINFEKPVSTKRTTQNEGSGRK